MLEELYIKDFALIREARIGFGPSLNLITGETGAGKSIILGALDLVLGSRATTDLIRSGARRSFVEALFRLDHEEHPAVEYLREHGIEIDEPLLLLKREISTEGRGRCFINAQHVPVAVLKKTGRFLVDIHGQNEHQNILSVATHRRILDRYSSLEQKVGELAALHREREELLQKLKSVSLDESEKNRRMEILAHEIKEIEAAEIEDERELDELSAQEKSLSNAEQILEDLSACYDSLKGESGSVVSTLSWLEKKLEQTAGYESSLDDPLNKVREAYYLLEDAASELKSTADSVNVDPEQLAIVRERLDLLQGLLRKYGHDLSEIRTYLEEAKREYDGIELSREEESRIREEIDRFNDRLCRYAEEISKERRKSAAALEKAVQSELADLGMQSTRVRISVKWEFGADGIYVREEEPQKKYIIHAAGLDIVEFLMAASEKENLRPLRKVASGGEMSRIMLALKKNILETDTVSTMVFDEVDAGIGGGVAEAVGRKLEDLSADAQVIVITHLHQIASLGRKHTRHFRVSKDTDEGTRIIRLSREQRIEELARMIGGEKVTDSALEHARSILQTDA